MSKTPMTIVPLTYFQALALALVEGVTEFLPISSNSHMRITSALMGWPDAGAAFSAIVQLGPIVAIIWYFRHDLAHYLAGLWRSVQKGKMFPPGDEDARLGWYIVLGTIPVIVLALLLKHQIEGVFRTMTVIAWATILFALVLLAAERVGRQTIPLPGLTLGKSLLIGVAQAMALIPGASRSGVTISMGLFTGLTREAAARYSFLLSVPSITLAGLYELKDVIGARHELAAVAGPYLMATVVAGFVAYAVIVWLLGYLRRHSTLPFIIYRLLIGIVLLYLLHTGYIHNVDPTP